MAARRICGDQPEGDDGFIHISVAAKEPTDTSPAMGKFGDHRSTEKTGHWCLGDRASRWNSGRRRPPLTHRESTGCAPARRAASPPHIDAFNAAPLRIDNRLPIFSRYLDVWYYSRTQPRNIPECRRRASYRPEIESDRFRPAFTQSDPDGGVNVCFLSLISEMRYATLPDGRDT